MIRLGGIALLALTLGACSGSSSQDAGTDSGPADNLCCGKAGDPGNSLGVGKYCNSGADCAGNARALLCSVVGDPTTHFCTFTCHADAGSPDGGPVCGENAVCSCGSDGCGCTSIQCSFPPDGGC